MKTFRIEINKDLSEQVFMEYVLNCKYSGLDIRLMVRFYSLANKWSINKFEYYWRLLSA